MPRRGVFLLLALIIAGVAIGVLALSSDERAEIRASLSLSEALGTGDTLGYTRALAPRPFSFPADHGPHPGFRTEWWYFTGNLAGERGQRFGYQLTFFRSAITADTTRVARASAWRSGVVYMAHFAVTDAAGERFRAFDRFAREALDLAGASVGDDGELGVWVEDWQATSAGAGTFPLRLSASENDIAIALLLEGGKAPVPQGDRGLSQKGPERGNASFYYSLTRMPTRGSIRIGDEHFAVHGASWMDREWSTSGLGPDHAGWDWFAVQLSDGRELMFYQIRRSDGSRDPFSAGSIVGLDGEARVLRASDVVIDVLGQWRSPLDGARYPSGWRLRVPSAGVDLRLEPLLRNQELNVAVRYWEGAVQVSGKSANQPVDGWGYVELTGYAGAAGRAGRARIP